MTAESRIYQHGDAYQKTKGQNITGFANAISAPAVEFKTEGFILGVGAKMFTIAGPVIVYGVSVSVVYGFIYWIWTMI
ncbi:MAG: SpoVA/SpoVAEb family sporulation membrane protein [Clostridia bacterium]|nr:SpoVA/SpoVAEb family sporulation membrane protein [Clostridia bacterium]